MIKFLSVAGIVLCLLVELQVVQPQVTTSPFVYLTIDKSFITISNVTMTLEPGPTNSGYYTNNYNTNLVVFGMATMIGLVGDTIKLSWNSITNPVIIQESIDLTNWQDIRVVLIGVTNYLRPVDPSKPIAFYRAKLLL